MGENLLKLRRNLLKGSVEEILLKGKQYIEAEREFTEAGEVWESFAKGDRGIS